MLGLYASRMRLMCVVYILVPLQEPWHSKWLDIGQYKTQAEAINRAHALVQEDVGPLIFNAEFKLAKKTFYFFFGG